MERRKDKRGKKGKERWKGKERRDFSKETLFPNMTSI
jgi:hypothetical protein